MTTIECINQCVIFDTEFTAWEGSLQRNWSGDNEHQEIIQLAAAKVKIHQRGAEILDEFHVFVKPTLNPLLSDYIMALTGIRQEQIDRQGVELSEALRMFDHFNEYGKCVNLCWGTDKSVIVQNCALRALDVPQCLTQNTDIRQLLSNKGMISRASESGQLAASLHLKVEGSGHAHNALYDVKSITAALNHWLGAGLIQRSELIQPLRD